MNKICPFSIGTRATTVAARVGTLAVVAGTLSVSATSMLAQTATVGHGKAGTPTHFAAASNASAVGDAGKFLHTNLEIVNLDRAHLTPPKPGELPPYAGYNIETPASLACVYHFAPSIAGCIPDDTTSNPTGGSETIAIVDAYDDPYAASDLAFFSAQFGLPLAPGQFEVVYSNGQPINDFTGGWELEESLDIEYSHAMAPKAKIYLVETPTNSFVDLFAGVVAASNLVVCGKTTTCPAGSKGKGEVSMSWSGGEFPDELTYDATFTTPGVVYLASTGDAPGVGYPSTSPNVIAAGGTSVARSTYNGALHYQVSWAEAGGGLSFYEPTPAYQAVVANQLGGARGVPDLSFAANPDTPVWVWDSFPYEGVVTDGAWYAVGGTSVAAPSLAGVINSAGSFAASTAAELSILYTHGNVASSFQDITYGVCGESADSLAYPGWDFCSGIGTPVGYTNK